MKALISESKGFLIPEMDSRLSRDLVEFNDEVRFQIDTRMSLGTADEPMLVVYKDGSWGYHSALEVDELIDQPEFHQAIPVNAVLRDFIQFETNKPVIDLKFATPVPA